MYTNIYIYIHTYIHLFICSLMGIGCGSCQCFFGVMCSYYVWEAEKAQIKRPDFLRPPQAFGVARKTAQAILEPQLAISDFRFGSG